ncbi:MAG: hypothetical protein MUC73_03925 [Cyclobacteriaceae bacterium]|jgi:hypothetical protein|nr:hypothetical protein [Cyclobacteriaceae bacterium]
MLPYFIHGFLILGLAWRIWHVDRSPVRIAYWPALVLKLGAGLLLGYIYSHHYTGSDTVSFFSSSIELTEIARTDFGSYLHYLWSVSEAPYSGENRTLFFVKIVSLFSLITSDHYWIVSLYFSLLSFFSAWWLVRQIAHYFPAMTQASLVAFLFFPSSVFWTSGVIKEAMAMMALYFLAGFFIRLWVTNRLNLMEVIAILFSTWILWNLKYFYAAVFFPVAATGWLTRWFVVNRMRPSARNFYRESLLFGVLFLVMLFIVTFIHPNFYPQRVLEVVVENYRQFIQISQPGKAIVYNDLQPTLGSIISNMPLALVSGLWRPFLWEASNLFQVLVSLENVFLFLFMVFSIKNFQYLRTSSQRILLVGVLVYCCMLCSFLALSAPNFGTLVRYRVGFIPFLVLLISYRSVLTKILSSRIKVQ